MEDYRDDNTANVVKSNKQDNQKQADGNNAQDFHLEEEEQDTTNESYEVERIVDRKIVSKGGKKVTMYKVRWLGYGPDDDQWLANDRLNCPELVAKFDRAIDATNEDEET